MSTFMQFVEATFKPMVLIFTVANLGVLGLQARMPELIATLKNKKAMALIFVWGWVLGPALAYVITLIIPLAEPYVIVLLLGSLAPCAPFFPIMVQQARGDMSFAGAFFPLVVVGTVVSIPLLGPFFVEGLTVSALELAEPLCVSLLLPLVIGIAARHYAETTVTKIIPAANVFARIVTAVMILQCFAIYGRAMLDTLGSFALLAGTIFMVVMGVIAHQFGFGLKQNQRSVMSLGMLQRNLAAILIAAFAIPNVDPRVITFTVMWGLWSLPLSIIAARIFVKQAQKTASGNTI